MMTAVEQALRNMRAAVFGMPALVRYGLGLAVGFTPAALFVLAIALYNFSHFSQLWGSIAVAVATLYFLISLMSLICLAASRFRLVGLGILTALTAVGIVALQAFSAVA